MLLVRRWWRVGRLAVRTLGRVAFRKLRPARSREAIEQRAAEDVAATLGQMKGAFMKAGQLLSFVDDAMPEHVRAALATLQDSAPPMPAAVAASVIESSLGAPPERVFRTWDPSPVAAASIGQVHRAVTRDGRDVAVKVQYPGARDVIAADLAQLDMGRFLVPALWPKLDIAAVNAELKARITEELDYSIEAKNQRDFAAWYADHPFIRIPRVVDELSSDRVLTTAFDDGDRFAEFEARSSQAERDRAAEAIFRFVFRSITDFLAFNGDPHPGNYLFGRDGSVTFVDFGVVKRLSPAARDDVIDEARLSALDPDPVALRVALERIGFYPPGNPLTDDEIFRFATLLWSHMTDDTPTTLTPEWSSEVVRAYLFKGEEFKRIDRWGNVPVDAVILQRITVGLLAILGRLRATANWHRIGRELLLGEPPSTPMGEAEAAWKRSRPADGLGGAGEDLAHGVGGRLGGRVEPEPKLRRRS